ncbi:MAG: PAS-domain containing protein [Burkholderiales bacterium]|nr:PAS-domain containing protein [Burkholderiales bacterium]
MRENDPIGGASSETIVVDEVLAALKAQLGERTDPNQLQAALQALNTRFCSCASSSSNHTTAAVADLDPVSSLPRPPALNPLAAPNLNPSTLQGTGLQIMRGIVKFLPLAISIFDGQLNLLACNRLFQDLLEIPDELFTTGIPNYARFVRFNAERGEYGPGDPATVTSEILARATSGQAHVLERVRPNGQVLEIRGTPLPDGGFLTIYSDITAHKRAEQAAARSETYLRAVIAQLPQGLTVIDENLDIVLWNRLWETNCGAKPGFLYDGVTFEAAVRHLAEMGEYGGGDAAEIDEQVAKRVELAKLFQPHCFRRVRPGGQVIEIEGRPMAIDGKVAGFITMYNDITDRLAIDDLKQAKEAAEAANRMKSEFLALISHEIRTPLAGVIGMLKFALRDQMLQAETRQLVERGQDSAQSLLAIINDLLDFSKIEAGKLSIENIDFAIDDMLHDVYAMFSAQALAKEIGFKLKIDSHLPHFVLGDPIRLRQVLINLIGNAFKFTTEGQVVLQVQMLGYEAGVAGNPGHNRLRFAVQDSGIGIAAEAVGRIFEKFEQADTSTTRRFGGTGLGLSISRQLVELMGGTIGVTSELGQGSEFYFTLTLPDGKEVQRQKLQQQQLQAHSHQLRVLCADDFATNQIIVRMLVEEMGHTVVVVNSGEEAVAAVAREYFDVILMDGRMPGMDGPTASRLIRAGGPPHARVLDDSIYIIAVTANASEEDRQFYLQAGMDDFLSKPIDENILHQQLARVIHRQLARGITLPPRVMATHSELDAMFGGQPATSVSPPSTKVFAPVLLQPSTVPRRASKNGMDSETESFAASMAEAQVKRVENEMLLGMRASFLQDIDEKMDLLAQALLARQPEEAGRLIHSVRGSAVYMQDTAQLQQLCLQLESQADRGNWEVVDQGVQKMKVLVDDLHR